MSGGHYTAFVNCPEHVSSHSVSSSSSSSSQPSSPSSSDRSKHLGGSGSSGGSGERGGSGGSGSGSSDTSCSTEEEEEVVGLEDAFLFHDRGLEGVSRDKDGDKDRERDEKTASASTSARWLMFDDDVVEVVPKDKLEEMIVTGTNIRSLTEISYFYWQCF